MQISAAALFVPNDGHLGSDVFQFRVHLIERPGLGYFGEILLALDAKRALKGAASIGLDDGKHHPIKKLVELPGKIWRWNLGHVAQPRDGRAGAEFPGE